MSMRKHEGRNALERALIFRRLRLSLLERFFFHFSLMLAGQRVSSADGESIRAYQRTLFRSWRELGFSLAPRFRFEADLVLYSSA